MKISSVAAPIRNAISHSSRWSRTFTPSPLAQYWTTPRPRQYELRLEAGFPVHLGEGVLADPRLVVLVDGDEGLFHLVLFVGGQRDDLRLAALLDRFERIVVFLLGDVVRVLGRVLHRAFERGADVRRQ